MMVTPTLIGPDALKVPSPNADRWGDPLAKMVTDSNGSGSGGGMGSGSGGGIGSGNGGGLGPGQGGGTGGGIFNAGTGGVGAPACIYCPRPDYSDEARKAKYQGEVLLSLVVMPTGKASNIEVVKSPGLGLDQKAIEAVRNWQFKPANGPDGKPVPDANHGGSRLPAFLVSAYLISFARHSCRALFFVRRCVLAAWVVSSRTSRLCRPISSPARLSASMIYREIEASLCKSRGSLLVLRAATVVRRIFIFPCRVRPRSKAAALNSRPA